MPRSGRFSYRGTGCRYLTWEPETGDAVSSPPLVLLHGFSQSADTWKDVAPLLARDRVVHAFELVGHGGSDRPQDAAAYALEAQAALLSAFLRPRLAFGKPIVVGYSMGGRVALTAFCDDPRPFGALVLESAGLGPSTADERTAATERDARNAARIRAEGVEAFMDVWEALPLFATQRSLPEAVRNRIRRERLSNDAEALACTFEGAGQHAMPDRDRVLRALEEGGLPLLYIAGEHDRKYRLLAESLLSLPHAEMHIVADAGHNTHLENPSAFVRVLSSFLSDREA